jgi:transcriptional regulator with GAF, ATPase, and Fis domain
MEEGMNIQRFGPTDVPVNSGGVGYPTRVRRFSSVDSDNRDSHEALVAGLSVVQHLIAELAEQFVAIDPRTIDESLSAGLRQLGEALQMDWAILWQRRTGSVSTVASHHWTREVTPSDIEPLALASTPMIASVLEKGTAMWFTRNGDVHGRVTREALPDESLRCAAVVPVALTDAQGALAFGSAVAQVHWPPALIEQLRIVAAIVSQALVRRDDHLALERARNEHSLSSDRASDEDASSRSNVRAFGSPNGRGRLGADALLPEKDRLAGVIVGQSAALRRVLEQAQQVAVTDATVLLLGETGTGKELVATHIHELSARRGRTMMRVNCSAIPSTLIESELFGREKGAFTGALARQIGRFESADRSTIFLDEIGDLPPDVQVKLLRVLEERQIERLGSPRSVPVDVRIIAATHRDLEKRIAEDAFREDLFYRLNVFPIRVPALRERPDDIPLLVWRFVIEFAKSFGKRIDAIPRDNMDALQRYHWPGNIRELRNVVERAMIIASGSRLTIALPTTSAAASVGRVRLEDVEREHIREILERVRWRIRGSGGAAEQLGLRPTTLETRMAKLGLARPKTA